MPTKEPPDRLPELVQKFFVERLQSQQGASVHTLASYRDTFRLLLAFIEQKTKRPPSQQRLKDWCAPHVLEFLDFLEKQRRCAVRTRNNRLAAIRAFMRYVAQEEPGALALSHTVLAIPMKRFDRLLVGYLSRGEVEAILAATDPATASGRRDHLLLSLLYNTGARVSEILALQRQNIRQQLTTVVEIIGKGRKQRSLPLWKSTATELKCYLDRLPGRPLQRQRDRDVVSALFFVKRDKIRKQTGRVLQFVPQSPAHAHVVLDCLLQPAHGAPPGQGSASDRRERRSTFA